MHAANTFRRPTGVNKRNRDFATAIVWSLQSECMLPPKLRLAVFAMALLSILSHPCVAGPLNLLKLTKWPNCLSGALAARSFVQNSFPPAPSLPQPITVFHLDKVDLSHMVAPPEFRRSNLNAMNTIADVLQIQRLPCQFLIPKGMNF